MGQWKEAGLTTRAQTFEPKRMETDAQWGEVQQFRNRAYDPSTGRWLQEDPIGVAGGINLYSYNGNNPATFRDPFGLCPWCIGAGIGAVAGAGGTLIYNFVNDRPLTKGLLRNTLLGIAAGATLGLGYSAVASGLGTEAAGAGTVAVSRLPFSDFPAWGREVVGWGSRASGALKAAAEMTAEKAASIDTTRVRSALKFTRTLWRMAEGPMQR